MCLEQMFIEIKLAKNIISLNAEPNLSVSYNKEKLYKP